VESLFQEPLGLQLVKKCPTYHGPRLFVALFTTTRHFPLSSARWIPSTPYFMILCNILLPLPRSSNQSPFQRSPYSNFVCIYLHPHTATSSTLGIRDVISLVISLCGIFPLYPKLYLVRTRNHKAPHYPVFFVQPPITVSLSFSLSLSLSTPKCPPAAPHSRIPCTCVFWLCNFSVDCSKSHMPLRFSSTKL
jgi:hypothetical protein